MNVFSITDIGKRRQMNQDYVYASLEPVGNLPNIFLVADGMGGHKAGGYASRCAVEVILDAIKQSRHTETAAILVEAIRKANECISRKADEDERMTGMGTTVVAATVNGGELLAANVGDSRLYVSNGLIEQVTEDHSLVQEMVREGGIDKEEAKCHPDKNIITRAVGVAPDLEVDCFRRTLKPGNVVLMCSDGLTNMLEDEEIHGILDGNGTIRERAEKLVAAANENGGRDNIAVILIDPFSV